MNVKELYDHITKHLTPEEALMKLLEGSLVQYEHLKFDDKKEPVHPLLIITMAALDMGWQLAIEKDMDKNDDKDVRGLAVGTEEYMQALFPTWNIPSVLDIEPVEQLDEDKKKFMNDYLDNICKPKPTTLNECFKAIDELDIDDVERKAFVESGEDDATINAHHGFGTWIRNDWGLWDEDSPLHKHFNTYGIKHADDMSSLIITSYHRYCNNRPIELIKQLEVFWRHWTEHGQELLPINISETEEEYLTAFNKMMLRMQHEKQ